MLNLTLNQCLLAGCEAIAIIALTFGNRFWRGVAPLFGLAGEAFYLMQALDSHDFGLLVVTLFLTVVWMCAILRALDAATSRYESDFLSNFEPCTDCRSSWADSQATEPVWHDPVEVRA